MFAATVTAAFLAATASEIPPQFGVEITVYQGDPLGTPGDGTVKTLGRPKLLVRGGQGSTVSVGPEVEVTGRAPGADGAFVLTKSMVQIGVGIELTVIPYPGSNKLYIETGTVERTVVLDGKTYRDYCEHRAGRTSRIIPAGEPYRVRISAASATDQTWAVVTVRPAR